MEKPKAFVSEKKKEEVKLIENLMRKHKVIGLVDIKGFPSPQLQKIRLSLREKLLIRISKLNLINIAIENLRDIAGLGKLKDNLIGMPALLFSNEEPFRLAKLLLKSKSNAPAKIGQIAPKDVVIKAGPTSFAPGPVIGELGAAGLKTGVEGGKIVVKEDKIIAKKGDVVTPKIADLLSKFKIEPMEVGLKILALYENGMIYSGDVLSIEDKVYLENVKRAYNEAFSLAIESGYIVKETAEHLIRKAELEANALVKQTKVIIKEDISGVIKEAEGEALALKEEIPEVEEKTEEKEEKKPESIVDELVQKAHTEGLKPEEKKTEVKKSLSEEDIKKAESFVKDLIDRNIKSDDLGKSASQLKKDREEEKRKKEKEKKEFEEAERAAKEVLNKA